MAGIEATRRAQLAKLNQPQQASPRHPVVPGSIMETVELFPDFPVIGPFAHLPPPISKTRPSTQYREPCLVCDILHPPSYSCPALTSSISLRMALDKLRPTSTTPASEDTSSLLPRPCFTCYTSHPRSLPCPPSGHTPQGGSGLARKSVNSPQNLEVGTVLVDRRARLHAQLRKVILEGGQGNKH